MQTAVGGTGPAWSGDGHRIGNLTELSLAGEPLLTRYKGGVLRGCKRKVYECRDKCGNLNGIKKRTAETYGEGGNGRQFKNTVMMISKSYRRTVKSKCTWEKETLRRKGKNVNPKEPMGAGWSEQLGRNQPSHEIVQARWAKVGGESEMWKRETGGREGVILGEEKKNDNPCGKTSNRRRVGEK